MHVYDPSTPQRRPVLELQFGEHPLTALSLPADGNTVAVGNTQGQIALLDLRKGGVVCGCLKGLSGGVRGLQCHASQPLVASCGLDRFLRVHSLEDRRLVHKVYLKSRLNCLLLASTPLEEVGRWAAALGDAQEVKQEEELSGDEVWDNMEKVQETVKRKKCEETEGQKKKKMKKKKKAVS